jgi:hypothetical protein
MPEGHQYDGPDKRSNNGNTLHVDITDTDDDDDLGHQPDADDCCNDCADEAERYSPIDDVFRDQANNGCNYQVNDKVGAERPIMVAKGDYRT